MRIVFLGTPDFAVASLKALLDNNFNVVGVVTMPDKKSGRGMKIQESSVKKIAIEKGLKVLQPENLKKESFQAELESLKPDLQILKSIVFIFSFFIVFHFFHFFFVILLY